MAQNCSASLAVVPSLFSVVQCSESVKVYQRFLEQLLQFFSSALFSKTKSWVDIVQCLLCEQALLLRDKGTFLPTGRRDREYRVPPTSAELLQTKQNNTHRARLFFLSYPSTAVINFQDTIKLNSRFTKQIILCHLPHKAFTILISTPVIMKPVTL